MDDTRSLRESLAYEPHELKFGTSGRRGDVVHLTQLEIYLNALADLEYLQSLPLAEGGIIKGEDFYYAYDLRPSSSRYVAEQGGRGELAQAIACAIQDAGMRPVNLGRIPTPALACYAIECGKGSIMITGSHIPFERNGYKTNTARGELLKKDEAPITCRVEQVRQRIYNEPFRNSPFNERGSFKSGHRELLPSNDQARERYIKRFTEFFAGGILSGMKVLVYQHSAVGRDLLVEVLGRIGAEPSAAGRSNTFVPIDTENIDEKQIEPVREMFAEANSQRGPIDAVVSTDGDGDRPLLLGADPARSGLKFYGGDLVGIIAAERLAPDAVVVPISCNDAVDLGNLRAAVEPKTRIGSPFVIEGMERARAKGRKRICGWEANGGFLTGSEILEKDRVLGALPTRDAVLPILCVLSSMARARLTMDELFARLPRRYGRAALLRHFPRHVSLEIVQRFSPADPVVKEFLFEGNRAALLDEYRKEIVEEPSAVEEARSIRLGLSRFFAPALGFGGIKSINYIDGVRILFDNGDIAHFRPSGNADELRIYSVADTPARADAIVKMGIAEPLGILRLLEKAVASG